MSQSSVASRTIRLTSYAALAGSIIPATAAGEIIGQSGLDIIISAGSPEYVDFGDGYGEIFRFSAYYFGGLSNRGVPTYRYSDVIQFDDANAGGWTGASLIRYTSGNDPVRLGMSDPIDASQNWTTMASFFNTDHDLAVFKTNGDTRGEWAPDHRGFIGLRITKDAGANYHHAWIDISVTPAEFTRGGNTIIVHAWGLETTPNEPLAAGAPAPGPAGLALLAMGAAGIRRSRGRIA